MAKDAFKIGPICSRLVPMLQNYSLTRVSIATRNRDSVKLCAVRLKTNSGSRAEGVATNSNRHDRGPHRLWECLDKAEI